MKIAVFYNISFSGAKRVVMEHVKGLRGLGNEVDVYTTDLLKDIFDPGMYANNKFLYKFSPLNLNVPIFNRIKKDYIDTFISLNRLHKRIAEDIDKKKYNIVLVHTDISTQAPFLLKFLKTKNVYFCLEPLRNSYEYSLRLKNNVMLINQTYENINRWLRKKIDRENTLSADKVLALSLFGRERIIAAYDLYPEVSYLGIDEHIFKPKKIKKKNQVFFVAGKQSIYGYDFAQKAMELIPKNIRPELKIVSWTKNNSERLSDKDLVQIYNESIVTLSLSKFDTFGLVPLESMACATPVIAFNVAGYRETIIDGKTGFLVDFDPMQIAKKIVHFIDNPLKAYDMGKQGRIWIEKKWTWKEQINNLNKIFKISY